MVHPWTSLIGFLNLKSNSSQNAAIPDLKPVYIEKEATMIEVNLWANQFMNYIHIGYRNGPPPQKGIAMHLRPLMHASYPQALEDKDPDDKNLEQLIELI